MKTGADYARTYRQRQRAKLERYEAALREIDALVYNISTGLIRAQDGITLIAGKASDALQDQ